MRRNRGVYKAFELLLKAVACFWILGGFISLSMTIIAASVGVDDQVTDLVVSLFVLVFGFGLFNLAGRMVMASSGKQSRDDS